MPRRSGQIGGNSFSTAAASGQTTRARPICQDFATTLNSRGFSSGRRDTCLRTLWGCRGRLNCRRLSVGTTRRHGSGATPASTSSSRDQPRANACRWNRRLCELSSGAWDARLVPSSSTYGYYPSGPFRHGACPLDARSLRALCSGIERRMANGSDPSLRNSRRGSGQVAGGFPGV